MCGPKSRCACCKLLRFELSQTFHDDSSKMVSLVLEFCKGAMCVFASLETLGPPAKRWRPVGSDVTPS